MQISNRERIGRALEHLRQGLLPFINSRMNPREGEEWIASRRPSRGSADFDIKDCLDVLNRFWDEKFSSPRLGRGARAWVNELVEARNQHAHPRSSDDLSVEDSWRVLDTAERLLTGVGAPQAESVRALKQALQGNPLSARTEAPGRAQVRSDPDSARRNQSEPVVSGLLESLYAPDLFGGLAIIASPRGVRSVRFGQCENRAGPMSCNAERHLREYAVGTRTSFDLPWDVQGTPFQLQVWEALSAIPYGETRSYADIARAVQKPKGAQAVGQANSRNPLFIIIPCHRVINADGSLGGSGAGEDKKEQLLKLERRYSRRAGTR